MNAQPSPPPGSLLNALTSADLARWARNTKQATETYQQHLNEINLIFDRDWDTGTNLTCLWRTTVADSGSTQKEISPADLFKMWGRVDYTLVGRSTRILKRVFQAMATSTEGLSVLTPAELADAFAAAANISDWDDLLPPAGSQPAGPQPGTILDVVQAAAVASQSLRHRALQTQLDGIAAAARAATDATPSFHDVLRRTGVVDAGALGLCVALQQLPIAVGSNRA